MRISNLEKRRLLEDVIVNGKTVAEVVRENNLCRGGFQELVQRARIHGIESVLHNVRNKEYPDQFKIDVVKEVEAVQSVREVAIKYNVTYIVVRNWCRKYSEGGIDELLNDRRGRPLKKNKPETQQSEKTGSQTRLHTEAEYRELEKRLRHAEMENEFLKKLDALVQERIERERQRKS